MRARARDLPRASLVLAQAFARDEAREALQTAQLARGFMVRALVHWSAGTVLVDGRHGALLYTRLGRSSGRQAALLLRGLVAGALGGLVLTVLSNGLLLLPVAVLLRVASVSWTSILEAGLVLALVRSLLVGVRGFAAYRLERSRRRAMPPVADEPVWRLDALGTCPPGRGHGARLMRELGNAAAEVGATVYLTCEPHNRAFYRRAGYRVVDVPVGRAFDGMLLMRRQAPPKPGSGHRRGPQAAVR